MTHKLKTETYSGKDLLQTHIFGFYHTNYDSNGYTPIKLKKSMNNVLQSFKRDYAPIIRKKLKTIGLELVDVKYNSPKYYNYRDDELDFYINISNLKKYMDFLKKSNILDNDNDYNLALETGFYNPDIKEMIQVFDYLDLTAYELDLDVEFILENIEYDMRYKENRGD